MSNAPIGSARSQAASRGRVGLRIHRGQDLADRLGMVASWRLRLFSGWPYLYSGNEVYEAEYGSVFARATGALLLEAHAGSETVGLATMLPLASDPFILAEAEPSLRESGVDPAGFFYLSEILVDPRWRGRGVGRSLFDGFRSVARSEGHEGCCLMAVERAPDHPLRPEGPDPVALWERAGFRRTGPLVPFTYPTFQPDGSVADLANPMGFWVGTPGTDGLVQREVTIAWDGT